MSQTLAPPARDSHCGEAEGHQGGHLNQARAGDDDRTGEHEQQAAAQRSLVMVGAAQYELHAHEQKAEHERLVVDTRDEVEQRQRVQHPEPPGRLGCDAAALGKSGQRPAGEHQAGDAHQPMAEDPQHDVVAGEHGDHGPIAQCDRAIGRRGVRPHQRHGTSERVLHPEDVHRTRAIRVQPLRGDRPLGEVGVDVLGEHRRGDRQGKYPEGEDAPIGADGQPGDLPSPWPQDEGRE